MDRGLEVAVEDRSPLTISALEASDQHGTGGERLGFKGGRTQSLAAARWHAEHLVPWLLANRHQVISPQNGEPLIHLR